MLDEPGSLPNPVTGKSKVLKIDVPTGSQEGNTPKSRHRRKKNAVFRLTTL